MAALVTMRQVIKEETTMLLNTAVESLGAQGSVAAREVVMKESPMAVGRVVAEEAVGGGESNEVVAGHLKGLLIGFLWHHSENQCISAS